MDLLNLWNDDPEEILLDLGFGADEPDLSGRIPTRFLNFWSHARGITVQVFLDAQSERMNFENPDVSNRFRQVEVLQLVAKGFSSLMGSSSTLPKAKDRSLEGQERRKRVIALFRLASKKSLEQSHNHKHQHTLEIDGSTANGNSSSLTVQSPVVTERHSDEMGDSFIATLPPHTSPEPDPLQVPLWTTPIISVGFTPPCLTPGDSKPQGQTLPDETRTVPLFWSEEQTLLESAVPAGSDVPTIKSAPSTPEGVETLAMKNPSASLCVGNTACFAFSLISDSPHIDQIPSSSSWGKQEDENILSVSAWLSSLSPSHLPPSVLSTPMPHILNPFLSETDEENQESLSSLQPDGGRASAENISIPSILLSTHFSPAEDGSPSYISTTHSAACTHHLQPARVSEPQQPAGISLPQQPVEASGPQQPSGISEHKQPVEDSGPQQPAGASSSQRLVEASGSEQPAEASESQQPADGSGPQQKAETSEPQQPAGGSGSQNPMGNFEPQQPAEASDAQQPAKTSEPQQPMGASMPKQPAGASGSQEPVEDSGPLQYAGVAGPQQPARTSEPEQPVRTPMPQLFEEGSGPQKQAESSGPQQPAEHSGPQKPEEVSGPQQSAEHSEPRKPVEGSGPQQPVEPSGSQKFAWASGPQEGLGGSFLDSTHLMVYTPSVPPSKYIPPSKNVLSYAHVPRFVPHLIDVPPSIAPSKDFPPFVAPCKDVTESKSVPSSVHVAPSVPPAVHVAPSVPPAVHVAPSVPPAVHVAPSVPPPVLVAPSVPPPVLVAPSVPPPVLVAPSVPPPVHVAPSVPPAVHVAPSVPPSVHVAPSVPPAVLVAPSVPPSALVAPSVPPAVHVAPSVPPSVHVAPSVPPSVHVAPSVPPSVLVAPSIPPAVHVAPSVPPSVHVAPSKDVSPSANPYVPPFVQCPPSKDSLLSNNVPSSVHIPLPIHAPLSEDAPTLVPPSINFLPFEDLPPSDPQWWRHNVDEDQLNDVQTRAWTEPAQSPSASTVGSADVCESRGTSQKEDQTRTRGQPQYRGVELSGTSVDDSDGEGGDVFYQQLSTDEQVYWAEPVRVSSVSGEWSSLDESDGVPDLLSPAPPTLPSSEGHQTSVDADESSSLGSLRHLKQGVPSVSLSLSSLSPTLSSHIVSRRDVPYRTESHPGDLHRHLPLDTSTPLRAVQSWADVRMHQLALTSSHRQVEPSAPLQTPMLSDTRRARPISKPSGNRTVTVRTEHWADEDVDRWATKPVGKQPCCCHRSQPENVPLSLDELEEMMVCLHQFRSVFRGIEERSYEDQAAVYKVLSPTDREDIQSLETLRRAVKVEAAELEQQLKELVNHHDDSLKVKMHTLLDEQYLLCSQVLPPWTVPTSDPARLLIPPDVSALQTPPAAVDTSEYPADKLDFLRLLQRVGKSWIP